jgi:four helix bundle protein
MHTDDRKHRRFEDLPVWQDARRLVKDVYAATAKPPFCHDRGFCDQIQRAAVSVPSNIAEGHERGTTQDLILFLFYSKGSAGEVRSQLYNAEDVGHLPPAHAAQLREQALGVSRQLSNWIQSMQGPGFRRGPQYHKEPDHALERFDAKFGIERLPDGRVREQPHNP